MFDHTIHTFFYKYEVDREHSEYMLPAHRWVGKKAPQHWAALAAALSSRKERHTTSSWMAWWQQQRQHRQETKGWDILKRSMRSLAKQHSQAEGGSCPQRPSHGGRQWEAGGREILLAQLDHSSRARSRQRNREKEKNRGQIFYYGSLAECRVSISRHIVWQSFSGEFHWDKGSGRRKEKEREEERGRETEMQREREDEEEREVEFRCLKRQDAACSASSHDAGLLSDPQGAWPGLSGC